MDGLLLDLLGHAMDDGCSPQGLLQPVTQFFRSGLCGADPT